MKLRPVTVLRCQILRVFLRLRIPEDLAEVTFFVCMDDFDSCRYFAQVPWTECWWKRNLDAISRPRRQLYHYWSSPKFQGLFSQQTTLPSNLRADCKNIFWSEQVALLLVRHSWLFLDRCPDLGSMLDTMFKVRFVFSNISSHRMLQSGHAWYEVLGANEDVLLALVEIFCIFCSHLCCDSLNSSLGKLEVNLATTGHVRTPLLTVNTPIPRSNPWTQRRKVGMWQQSKEQRIYIYNIYIYIHIINHIRYNTYIWYTSIYIYLHGFIVIYMNSWWFIFIDSS